MRYQCEFLALGKSLATNRQSPDKSPSLEAAFLRKIPLQVCSVSRSYLARPWSSNPRTHSDTSYAASHGHTFRRVSLTYTCARFKGRWDARRVAGPRNVPRSQTRERCGQGSRGHSSRCRSGNLPIRWRKRLVHCNRNSRRSGVTHYSALCGGLRPILTPST